MWSDAARHVLGLFLAALLTGCRAQGPESDAEPAVAAPAPRDVGSVCADLGERRACWTATAASVTARPVPSGAAPPDDWRCGGMGAARVCEDRRHNGDAFACEGSRCVQHRPRMPDDGEWDCVEMDGIAWCRRRADAAGVAPGPLDLGWLCGSRSPGVGEGERVCLDFDPDRPAAGGRWSCRYDVSRGHLERVCEPSGRPAAGDPCSTRTACPVGMACADGACLPPRPTPSCWLDADCGAGARCRWGTCEATGTR